jgi:hypothetical protein
VSHTRLLEPARHLLVFEQAHAHSRKGSAALVAAAAYLCEWQALDWCQVLDCDRQTWQGGASAGGDQQQSHQTDAMHAPASVALSTGRRTVSAVFEVPRKAARLA